jgi:hypothetical protein
MSVLSNYDVPTNRCHVELSSPYGRYLFDGQTGEKLGEQWDGAPGEGIKLGSVKGMERASWDQARLYIDRAMGRKAAK